MSINFETGSGFVRVNPSCVRLVERFCYDALPIGGNFIGWPALRGMNRFIFEDGRDGVQFRHGFLNSAAFELARGLAALTPAITGSVELLLKPDGTVGSIRHGDKYPSLEIYQRLKNGMLRVVDRYPEPNIANIGAICLVPGIASLC